MMASMGRYPSPTCRSLPERKDVDPVTIKTSVLSCNELVARGELINEFKTDVTGSLTVQWVDFFGDVYHTQTEGPYRVGPGQTVDWMVEVTETIALPGHCTVELDFFN